MNGRYALLIGAVAVERVAELVVSQRNWTGAGQRGGVEVGARHYPVMVVLHTGLLAGCLVEAIALRRRFIPALGWPMLVVVLAAQGLRWWCITTLGRQWNTRVVVVPGAARVTGGTVPRCAAPELRRGRRGRGRAAVGALGVDHRAGVHGAQRGAAEDADQGRERCAGEPDVIDLLVAGGGPAGLATALYGARAGLEVVVVERRSGAIDKACGEGLMPHTVAAAGPARGHSRKGRPLRGISYVDGERRVDAEFRSGAGRGVRRTALHAALLEAARRPG